MSKDEKKSGGGSQTIGGAPTKKRVDEFYDLMDAAQESGPVIPDLDVSTKKDPNMNDFHDFILKNQGKFPIRPLPKDPYDTMWKIKQDLKQGNYVSAARPLPVTEEDLRYLKGKAAAEDYTAFLTWESSKYDLSDPATKEWFHNICPSYFEQREQLIDDMIDLEAKYAKIRLRGPRSEDDLKLEFLIEKGDIQLPNAPIWDPITIYSKSDVIPGQMSQYSDMQQIRRRVVEHNKRVYQAGLFSPLVPMSAQPNTGTNHQQVMGPNPFNRADVMGDPAARFTGISGGLPPVSSNYNQYTGVDLGLPARELAFANNQNYANSVRRGWDVISGGYPRAQIGGVNAGPAP